MVLAVIKFRRPSEISKNDILVLSEKDSISGHRPPEERRSSGVIPTSLAVNFVISAGLAWTLPLNILDTHRWFAQFCRIAITWLPSIKALADNSLFPQVTALTLSVLWLTTPWHVVRIFRIISANRSLLVSTDRYSNIFHDFNTPIKLGALIVICCIILYVLAINPPLDPRNGTWSVGVIELLGNSRLAFGSLAGLVHLSFCVIAVLVMEMIVNFHRITKK